jgi:hypothetical protein
MTWIKGQIPVEALELGKVLVITTTDKGVYVVYPRFRQSIHEWALYHKDNIIPMEYVMAWQFFPEPYSE